MRAGFALEVRVVGERLEQRALERGHVAIREGDAVEEADDALRHRAHVVEGVRTEGHLAQGHPQALVVPREVLLEHEATTPHDDHPVEVSQPPVADGDADSGQLTRIETGRRLGGECHAIRRSTDVV
jgi:hypothetical protein